VRPAAVTELPAAALILLVGPAGAGKSTWAARHFDRGQILESDHFRQLVAGDAADQSATGDAFKALHIIARARLRRGLTTVVDATNLTVAARRALLRIARQTARPAVAVAFDVSLQRCLRQNARRVGRAVPEAIVRRQQRAFPSALACLPSEGYAAILHLRDADVDLP
jgi:protein phosphatase